MAYVWHTDLAKILREAGLEVVEHSGWKTRGRPTNLSFAPTGCMFHHDASPAGPSPSLANYIARVGRPPGTPPPLSQLWVSKAGVWHVLAAGRANHAGSGSGWGNIRANTGNSATLGVEWDHTTGESITAQEYDSLVTGFAAIFKAKGWNVSKNLAGHKEYAAGRKIDPSGVDMAKFRSDVKARQKTLGKKPTPKPVVKSHTRWATRETGVYKHPKKDLQRMIPRGYEFKVIDGSGHGKDGWIQTTHGNWVNGYDTTAVKDTWKWDPEVKSDLAKIQHQFHIAQGAVKGEDYTRYHGIAAIQNALNVKNGESLPVDGFCSPELVRAWRRWEEKHPGTGWTGTPDMKSLKALQIAYRFKEATQDPKPAPEPKPEPDPDPAPAKKHRTFPVATANVGTRVTQGLFEKASAGVQVVGWQEVDSKKDWTKLNGAMSAYRNVGVTQQNPQHNTPISVRNNWTVVESGFHKLYDGESGISHTRHATWSRNNLNSDKSLTVAAMSVHWPSAAFDPSGAVRKKGDRIPVRVAMWNQARTETIEAWKTASDDGRLPTLIFGDFNRQKVAAFSDADFGGRKVRAVAHSLDWIYMVDGDSAQWDDGGETFLRSVGSDHKTFGKHVGINWS